ncbi:MAG TPA: biopolymer transporter ExbD [Candidatus Anaerobiospirillum stercoravium]|nr:biopolymer transporter ExbD [Candidatus Anaerobiospirillum stercoravium]
MNDLENDDLAVDLTALIDVTFMLVIFFIMTMSFTLPVIDFNLPQSSTAQSEERAATMRISVDAQGHYSVGANTQTTKEQLPALIQQELQKSAAAQQELTLELVIDAKAPSQELITVADLARTYTQGRLVVVSTPTEQAAPAPTDAADASSERAAEAQ